MITELTVPADPDWPARVRDRAHHIVSTYESCTQSIVAAFMEEFGSRTRWCFAPPAACMPAW